MAAVCFFIAVTGIACQSADSAGQSVAQTERSAIPEKYQWNLSHIYKEVSDFESDFEAATNLLKQLKGFAGSLRNPDSARATIKAYFEAKRLIYNLDTYAARLKDSDMNNAEAQKLYGRVETLYTNFVATASYMEPEILALPEETVKQYLADPSFKEFRRALDEIVRWRPYILTAAEEKVAAEFTGVAYAPYEAYSIFTSTDMPRPTIELSTGEAVRLDDPFYVKYRTLDNRADRELLFVNFWDNYGLYRNTFAKTLNYQTKYYVTDRKLKKFPSSLHKKLFEKELPSDFYEKLIGHIRAILPALHDYMALKKEMLGVDKVRFPDMYVPLSTVKIDKSYTYEQAGSIINEAIAPMPDEFKKAMAEGMAPGSGWVDVYPVKGKADGAYCSGSAYATHPYILLNWTDDFDSLSTFAHEMGHGMHSYFSNKYQPFSTSNYDLFVAEVASIFNEMMLSAHLIKKATTPEEKIFFLNQFIETARGTVFRQMMFAEFEKRFYDIVEQGSSLTPEAMNALYKEINHDYYGAAKGLYEMDDRYAVEWSYIPHFYYNYYVFQYVVGFVGALSLATKVLEGTLPPEQYVQGLLMAGGSKSPLDILRDAGVDMTADEPYQLTAKVFTERIAELRKLLKEQQAKKKS